MQIRSALQAQMSSTLGTANPQAALQQGMGHAEGQLQSLKDKLSAGSFGDAGEMPTTKTNEENTRSLWKRLTSMQQIRLLIQLLEKGFSLRAIVYYFHN